MLAVTITSATESVMFSLVISMWTDWSRLMAAPLWSSLSGSRIPSASWQPQLWCCHPRPSFSLQHRKSGKIQFSFYRFIVWEK